MTGEEKTLIGQSIAHFRVTEKIGAGGMGEVYRATDSRLNRDVALKIVPAALASDEQRMARFEREAQLLAALNHPHIATIHGLEVAGPTRALVMELVPGPTLADRIAQGPVPLEEALTIAKQIAEALEYAHERGIIHRDLKPANVKLTPDGQVKLLDFGLAKAMEDSPAAQDISNSPTLSAVATKAGIILGTAAYMSPEQAKGKPVDRRADIWSFGVVLYEMLTGKTMYTGETAPETMAHVITKEPEWSELPAATPARIRRLLERCLTKDPKRRLRDIGEARIAIEDYLANPGAEATASTASGVAIQAAAAPMWKRVRRGGPWAGMAVFALAAIVGIWRPWVRGAGQNPPVRLNSDLGVDGSLNTDFGASAVLSPDGTRIVYVVNEASGSRRLYLRALDQLQAAPLYGTEGGRDPFFSPDGEWIGFFATGALKKISVHGGGAITICEASNPRGGSWGEDGSIVFEPLATGGLFRISSSGGKAEELTKMDAGGKPTTHRWPQILPGGKAVLFTTATELNTFADASLEIVEMPSGARKTVYRGGFYGRYVKSGQLLFEHDGTLFAMPFDLKGLEPTGQGVPVAEQVLMNTDKGSAQFSVSETGLLAYLQGKEGSRQVSIDWMGKDGKLEPLVKKPNNIYSIQFSPDGKRLAMEIYDSSGSNIWTYDMQRDTLTRLTFAGVASAGPVWTRDGQRIAYSMSENGEPSNLYWKRADGAGNAQRLTQSKGVQYAGSWSPDGKTLVFFGWIPGSTTSWDLYTLTIEGDEKSGWKPGEPKLFLGTPATEVLPAFSPDGRWVAYESNESGSYEIYVRPFPGPGGKWQISSGGGFDPQWSQRTKELFYKTSQTNDGRIMVARYSATADAFQAEKPVLWSEGQFTSRGTVVNFALHPDGKRFAVLKAPEGQAEQQFNKVAFVFNFFEELRRKAAPTK